MLYFVSAELALGYWFFAFLSTLGALQWVAVRYRLRGLAFLQSRRWGYALASLLVVSGAATFFISQWEPIFAPGPAGSELAVLFATSAVCALAATLVLAPLLERWRSGPSSAFVGGADGGRPVTMGHATGWLYMPPVAATPASSVIPAGPQGAAGTPVELNGRPAAAVCLLPAYGTYVAGVRSMSILARRLAAEGLVALVVNPDEQAYAYPAILATLPAAVAALREHLEVDPNRIAALGEDLGGNLVIRAVSTSREIKAAVALAPALADVPSGLGLLREMPYLQALRWARDRKRATLRKELNALEYGTKVAPRQFLVLCGRDDQLAGGSPPAGWGLTPALDGGQDGPAQNAGRGGGQLQVIPGLGHINLAAQPEVMRFVSQWLKEHL